MIRPFTVFCRLDQISFSDRQWLEKEAGSLSHTDGICPVCHAKACLYQLCEKGGMEVLVPRTRCDRGGPG